ncbi:MAG: hypothetical protein HZB38_01500 [Planctomycetes bacterium]|nr:hypothetical protein [Planctomycetota bacterium]
MNDLLSQVLEYRPSTGGPVPWQSVDGRRFDLHCHSTYSNETLRFWPGLIYHPLLTPQEVYDLAKARGMDFVTITDHDTIDGCKALLDARGDLPDFVIGEEVSVAFPEDGTVVHVNVFDINEEQHRECQRLRRNIYDLTRYLRGIDKLFVLNHMTWTAQRRVLKRWQIEAMLQYFDVFEVLNGARSFAHNAFALSAVRGYPKVRVAGSDSHTHRVGTTYTLTRGNTAREAVAGIRAGVAEPCGAFGTPEKLRDDVWLVLTRNVERRLNDAGSAWERAVTRLVGRIGRATAPLICLGYHTRQNMLIRRSLRALPA